ncbi:MAG TPA: class I SAM-dependent methyltransferase [Streptosporangiaceae bacterium]|nr:class I SAM-dependent methyltransferase [Streptosporangiaceae bacterium]
MLAELTSRWRDDLAAWAIPEHIMASVTESPWVLPAQVFARRADKLSAEPAGRSFEREWAALDPPGTVLDVGAGAGAASLPLAPRTTKLTAVDSSQQMLDLLGERAAARRLPVVTLRGTWPASAGQVPAADLVACHHVLYNVPDIEPFLSALTAHARRLVVVEITVAHPLSSLNDLWRRFHGLARPDRPTSDDVLAILAAMGVRFGAERWRRGGGPDYPTMAELVDVTRRRLCLPPDRADEVTKALIESGVDPAHPQDLGSSGSDVLTIWWNGSAQESGQDGPAVLATEASWSRDDESA